MANITDDSLDTLNELQAEVRYAYGECIITNDEINYVSEPDEDMTEAERRQILENMLDHVADILEEYDESD